MLHSIRIGTARRVAPVALVSLALLSCERDGVLGPGRAPLSSRPTAARIVASYAGTATATFVSSFRTSTARCPAAADIDTQNGNDFSGSFTIQSARGCDAQQGTVAGTVRDDGTVTFTADTPGGGSDVWQDGAARTHCRLVNGSAFDGTIAAGVLTASGQGEYHCSLIGTVHVRLSFQLSTQG